MAELRSSEQEPRQKVVRCLNRSHEDELDTQRAEARSARMKLERELSTPPPAAPAPVAAPVPMAAPVAHAQAHLQMSMQQQPLMNSTMFNRRQQFQVPNMGQQQMWARNFGYQC